MAKRSIQRAKSNSPKAEAATDHSDDDDDSKLFRSMMQDVTPLTSKQAAPTQSKPAPRARSREADEFDIKTELTQLSWYDIENAETGDELSYQGQGLHRATWQQLQRGQFAIEARLDLHGMRRDEAAATTKRFVRNAHQQGQRCILIIHGKGQNSANGGVLKKLIDSQLRRNQLVVGFSSARPADGGSGSVYVLVRRQKR